MKRFPLLLPLVAVVFAVACTDATAPANSHAILSPSNPSLGALGNPPPPPVDAAITITVSSFPQTAPFTGVYFSNGETIGCDLAAAEVGDLTLCDFMGTAWLRLDNTQPDFGGAASANTRFKRQDDKLSGMGTLSIGDIVVKITSVEEFISFNDCGSAGQTCAIIMFTATDSNGGVHSGVLTATNKSGCEIVFVSGGEGETGHYEYSCPSIG
jgi:hypothetical protein